MKINKAKAKEIFDGTNDLFNACWKQYREYLKGSIDNPTCQEDIDAWLDTIASEKVNNPKSKFYIYG